MAEILSSLIGDPPDLRVSLLQGQDVLSISRREAAIGFRTRQPSETGLADRKLWGVEFAPFAVAGAPDRRAVVRAETPSACWVAERHGESNSVEVNTPRLAMDLVLKSLGHTMLPTFVGDRPDTLERVGPVVDELSHDQWLVCHDDDRNLPEIRRAINRIGRFFGQGSFGLTN